MAEKTERKRGPAGNYDYVKRGSDQHAALLGLKPADDGDAYVREGPDGKRKWALADPTAFGVQATEAYLREVLRQKVSELYSDPPVIQSDDPMAPGYAPPMIVPPEERERIGGT